MLFAPWCLRARQMCGHVWCGLPNFLEKREEEGLCKRGRCTSVMAKKESRSPSLFLFLPRPSNMQIHYGRSARIRNFSAWERNRRRRRRGRKRSMSFFSCPLFLFPFLSVFSFQTSPLAHRWRDVTCSRRRDRATQRETETEREQRRRRRVWHVDW